MLQVTLISGQSAREEFKDKINDALVMFSENPEKGVEQAKESYRFAEEINDPWAKAIGMSSLGYMSYHVRDYEAAYLNYFDAFQFLEQADTVDLFNSTNVLQHLAMVHSKFNNYDRSIQYRTQALRSAKEYLSRHWEHAKEHSQTRIYIDMTYFLAVEYDKKGAHQTAGKILMELWEDAEDKGDVVTHARVLNKLGIIKKNNGEYSAAIDYFSLVAFEKEVPQKYQAIAYHNLGETYMVQGNYNKAQSYYLIALDMKKGLGNDRSTFITYLGLGELEYKKENMVRAIDFWETALSIFDKVENEPELYTIYNWLQLAYMDIDVEKAKAFNQSYSKLNDFYVRNQTFQREEEAEKREALSMLIDQQRQQRVEAAQRDRFISQFWPVFVLIGLLVCFSAFLGVRYYMALKANKLLTKKQLKLQQAQGVSDSSDKSLSE
jgi:tetratricopeptide (TPR) repeat protein